jgi:peptidoglycan-N-acetylglucosamine deacetylase
VSTTAPRPRTVAVALTFDFDAESAWLGAMNFATPSALARGAYGANEGVPRILAMLSKYNLPATFFIPGDTADRHPNETKAIVDAGHEIGHHGYLHEAPHLLLLPDERKMLERGLEALARVTSQPIVGYRAPSWELSENTLRLLIEYGFKYDATQLAADRPYWAYDGGDILDLVEIPSAWELCDSSHFMFAFNPSYRVGLAAPSNVEEIWRDDFDGLYAEGSDACVVLTMHPQIIGRPHRMAMVERIIQHIKAREGVWFAQMGDISLDFRERHQSQRGS